ncbi:MAG TPA: ABC transporter ATP-binding protein [Acidimicrobiales bacterium]|nr:ABC transporter ATP-binding protein [Acidimicrobiales bacterium]
MARLEVAGVEVRFGGVVALRGVDLVVDSGRVTGLIGPNGAGKTTLFNVITGLQKPQAGRVFLDGDDIVAMAPHRRARLGIARTFQRLEIFGSLTVRENILVAAEIRRRWARDGSNPRRVAESVIDRVGLRGVARERCDTLPTGMARLVEVGRSLATEPHVLLLDEPSSGLDEQETDDLADLLLDLAGDGMGVLLVEHDVEMVMSVCHLIHVLDFGRILAVGSPTEIQSNPEVRAAYLGTEDEVADTEVTGVLA